MAKAPRRSSSRRRKRFIRRRSVVRRRGRVVRARPGYAAKRFRLYRNPLNRAQLSTCLQYQTNISLNPTTGAIGSGGSNLWTFAANGLYDPDITGVGHQPMYFDNFAAVYNRYRVNFSKITVTVVNHSVNTDTAYYNGTTGILTNTPNYSYKLAIVTDRDLTSVDGPSNIAYLIEEGGPNIKWRFISPSLVGVLPKLYHFATPSRLTGLVRTDDSLQADTSSNPSRLCYYHIAVASADGNTDPPGVYLHVHLKFWVTFFDRKIAQPEN